MTGMTEGEGVGSGETGGAAGAAGGALNEGGEARLE